MVGVTVESKAANSRGQLFFVAVWFTVTALLVVVSQVVNAPQALGDDGAAGSVTAAADYPLTGIDPAEVVDPSAVYGGVLWSVTEARTVDADGLFDRATIEVDVTLTNTLAATSVRVPDSMVSLVTGDDRIVSDGRFVDAGARLSLDPGEQIDVTIHYEVGFTQAPQLEDFSLRIAEPNRVPAFVRLAGEQAPTDYPIFAAVETNAQTTTDPDDPSRQIIIAPLASSIDVNAGAYRAAIGEQLAVVKVEVQRAEALADAGYVQPDYWALEVDGEQTPAIFAAVSSPLASNSDEVTLLFAFPEDPSELAVVAGTGDDAVSFAVVIPS